MGDLQEAHDLQRRIVDLNERRRLLTADLENVDALVVVLDAAGRIVKFNQACERLMGIAAADVLGKPIVEVQADLRDPFAWKALQGTAIGVVGAQQESEWTDAEGMRRRVLWSSTCLQDLDGAIAHVVCVGFEQRPAAEGEFDVGTWEAQPREIEALDRLVAVRPAALANPQVGPAIRWIADHFREPISLRDVAAAVSYSPAYLTDLCRKATGITVQAWIIGLRMLEARRLLVTTKLPLDEIAASIGYRDVGHFARQFRQYHGKPPATWRKEPAK